MHSIAYYNDKVCRDVQKTNMGSNGSRQKTNGPVVGVDADGGDDDDNASQTSRALSDKTLLKHVAPNLTGAASNGVVFHRNHRVLHNGSENAMREKKNRIDRWYMEDVTTTSHEPRRSKHLQMNDEGEEEEDKVRVAANRDSRKLKRPERRERNENDQEAHQEQKDMSSGGSQPPLYVNTPQNVAMFMEKFDSDIKLLLPYCFGSCGEAEFSIALCFVSRLTMQDRIASQRAECRYFPPFQSSQRAFYFRLIPVGEQSDRLFVVEYYDRPEYLSPALVFNPHGWIQFEALLRLFFHQGYRYLMKLFPEPVAVIVGNNSTVMRTEPSIESLSSSCGSSEHAAFSVSIPDAIHFQHGRDEGGVTLAPRYYQQQQEKEQQWQRDVEQSVW